ncbi:MAG: nucleoside deaminase [Selenomonadaceae bacterium]
MEKEAFMQAAIEESRHNLETNEGGPFGAVIVKNGKIIGRGHNQVLAKNDPTCHAEIQAIRSACGQIGTYDLTGCQLYTSCYPCPMCLSAIIWANIKQVFYANTADDAAGIGFRDDFIYRFIEGKCQDAAVLELTGAGRTDAIKIFKLFEQKTDKTIY